MGGLDLLGNKGLRLVAGQRIDIGQNQVLVILIHIEILPNLEQILLERQQSHLRRGRGSSLLSLFDLHLFNVISIMLDEVCSIVTRTS